MKKIFKSIMFLAAAATAFTACNKEVEIQDGAKTGETTIRFSAVVNDAETKATLTTEDEKTFKAAWETTDKMDVVVTGKGEFQAIAEWKGSYYEFAVPDQFVGERGNWYYTGYYPSYSVPFGSNRVQKGNTYASEYDVMYGYKEVQDNACGLNEDGSQLVIPMERKSSILYFHLSSDLDEALASATLTVEEGTIAADAVYCSTGNLIAETGAATYNTITITFPEGEAPNAQDFCLWYNILPGATRGLTLEITTTSGKTATISNANGKTYVAGKLNKVVKSGLTWETGAKYYVKVTSEDELKNNGQYLIVYEMGETGLAFDGSLETLDAVSNNIEVEISENKIVSTEEIDASAFTISVDSGSILSASGLYIGVASFSNGLATSATSDYVHNFSFDSGNAVIGVPTSGGTMTLRYNKASNQDRFRYYKSGQEPIALYLLEGTGETPKASAGLAFESEEVELTYGDEFTAPELINPYNVQVIFTSSNESVATVDEDGVVEILAVGNTTITAAFEGNDTYKAGSASYTLRVLAPPTRVSDVIAGGAGNYTLNGVTVYAVAGSNYIIGDATGRMVLFKNNLSAKVGDVINVNGPVVVYNDVLEFNNDADVEITGETVTVDHGAAAQVTTSTLSVFNSGNHSAIYVQGTGIQSNRNITVGDITLYLNVANAATDNSAVVFSGYVVAYNTSHATYTFQAVDLSIDETVATMEVSPKTLSWNADEYGSDKAKAITVSLNGEASGYTVSYTDTENAWSVSDDEEGNISVYPVAANESEENEKTLTITITHDDDASLSETVTLTQDVAGQVLTEKTMTLDFESAATTYTDWTITTITTQQTNSNVPAHGGSYFGSTDGKASGSIVTKSLISNPGKLTFYISKTSTNTTASSWLIKVSTDNTSWTQVGDAQSASAGITRGTWTEVTRDLSSYKDVYVKIEYSGTTAVRCLDDVTLVYYE